MITPVEAVSRVLVVDDHAIVRAGSRLYLEGYDDLEVIGEATDGMQALRLITEPQQDVLLMDLARPGLDGVEATRRIKAALPDVEVIVLTSFVEDEQVTAVVQAGAIGYVLKSADPSDIVAAARAARRGEVHLDPDDATIPLANPLAGIMIRTGVTGLQVAGGTVVVPEWSKVSMGAY